MIEAGWLFAWTVTRVFSPDRPSFPKNRSFTNVTRIFYLSCLHAGDIPDKILSSCNPAEISLRLHRDRLLKSEIYILWNQIWSSATTGAQTRLFFPSVEAAAILDSPLTPFFLCSFLSGQCILNKFLFKIKRKLSPLCPSLSGDE